MCCAETDHTGSEKLLQQIERIVSCMGRSSILLKPHSAPPMDSKSLTKFSIELVDNFTATLAVDCHCLATPVLKPVRSMSEVECYPCGHFGALQMFLTHLNGAVNNHNVFWGEEPPEEVSEKHLKGAEVTAWIAFNLRHGPHCMVSRRAWQDNDSQRRALL